METPYDAIRALVDYLWKDEERHYELRSEVEAKQAKAPHIFEHLQALATWLEVSGR